MGMNTSNVGHPGFQAFSPDHTRILFSNGQPSSPPTAGQKIFYQFDVMGNPQGNVSLGAHFGTQPDWTKDGLSIYYTSTDSLISWLPHPGNAAEVNDDHFSGGSIFKMSYDPAGQTFGTPQPVVMTAGALENNYYPSVSPDGQFLVWNRAVASGSGDMQGLDGFNNPKAQLYAMYLAGGGQPVLMSRANVAEGLTNSWPRWSPFVQVYQGKPLLWVTFSSTRDYGLRVHNQNVPANENGPTINCYPPDSPEAPCPNGSNCHCDCGGCATGTFCASKTDGSACAVGTTGGCPDTDPCSCQYVPQCNHPQIWMAAVSLSDLEFHSTDPSYPAFWLPFQNINAHNHIAQWTEVVQPTMCVAPNGECDVSPGTATCCSGSCKKNSDNSDCTATTLPSLCHCEGIP
jgi:hypothetical protein